MDSYKKHKFKEWVKKKKGWIIGTGVFLLAGTILLFVGLSLTGFNIIEWLHSGYFVTFLVFTLGFALLLIYVIIDLIRLKLGANDDSDDIFKK